ncbi:transketolase [Erythrobacter longus]|uniref:Transketolase n=1 Tax=Erythrobacter longus TaxID=1044 RepID=A0A074MX16_ERYLO|nr:1-deoxy-D-xylulose-5-phosphate synthase N-terminal domain-containing protein [Erythrobacter longus]KEO90107.1 transketolase [Erythrobacter longus]
MASDAPTALANDDWLACAQRMAERMRVRGFDYVMRNDGGYLSQICSSAEIFSYLYTRGLNIGGSIAPLVPEPFAGNPGADNPGYTNGGLYNGPRTPDFDRFYFSPAHYALVLYVALIECGRLSEEALEAFNKDGSKVELIGAEHSPGVESTTGSLGQALSQAIGVAMARRHRDEAGNVWVMMSDGEFQEGQTWEAIQCASHYKLGNLAAIVDVNAQQCDGPMEGVMTVEPLAQRIRAFGGEAVDIDGHDMAAMDAAFKTRAPDRPLFILARTDPTRGVPLMNERPVLHYLRFGSHEERARYQAAFEQLKAESAAWNG